MAVISQQAVKEELNEDTNESLYKNLASQTSISEKQVTADEKFSEEGVRDKLPSRSIRLCNSLPTSPYSFRSLHDHDSWCKFSLHSDPQLPYTPIQQRTKRISSARSVHNIASSKIKGDVEEKRDQVLPTTTVQRDPDTEDSITFDLISRHSYKRNISYKSAYLYPQRSNVSKSHFHDSASFSSPCKVSDCDTCERSEVKSAVKHKRTERKASCFSREARRTRICRDDSRSQACDGAAPHYSLEHEDQFLHLHINPNSNDTDDCGPGFEHSSSIIFGHTHSQSKAPTVTGPPCPQGRPTALQDSTVCTEGSGVQDAFELLTVKSESKSGGDNDVLVEMEAAAVPAVNYSVTNTLPTHSHLQTSSSDPGWTKTSSSCLSRSHSMSSLSQVTSAKNKTFTRSNSSPDMLLKNSFEEFTPDITADEDDETYRFQCSCPGLYQCSVTGLVFHMEAGGDVVYRIVPWNRRLLAQHHKQPAGPLFDIKCLQQSVCQLHLPHCEIRSTGGCEFLSVAHVTDEGIEFIAPDKITETHVVINITGFSGFGTVKDEDSPPNPVRALVLLFYRPPTDPDVTSLLNVLLLPRNIVLRDVLRTRKENNRDESYIETSPHCELHPNQEYTLSTCPEDSVRVQPRKAKFDCDNYENYFPSFQAKLKTIIINIELFLRDTNTSNIVWESEVCLSSTGVKRSCGQSALNLPPDKRLFDIRSSFIDRVSGPVLQSLLDKLFEKKVMTDSERESANEMQNKRDKARFVIDTVRNKGEAASSEMIEFLCEADPFLCKHLDLI